MQESFMILLKIALAFSVLPLGLSAADAAKIEAHASTNGSLNLSVNGKQVCEFTLGLFDESWRSEHAVAAPNNKFTIKTPSGVVLDGEASFKVYEAIPANLYAPLWALKAEYAFTAREDVKLASLNVSADFPIATLAGTKWKMDNVEGTFPSEYKDTGLRSGKIKSLNLEPANAPFSFSFSEPIDVLIQDNRQWNTQTFSVRIGRAGVFKRGETVKISYDFFPPGDIKLTRDGPVTIVAGADWIPLKTELDIEAGSALDFSGMNLTEAPAGKFGRVICRDDGQFVFENERTTPRRFYGVNLAFSGQFMTHDEADRLADRFARIGYNAVRIHHYEGILTQGKNSTTLNDEKLDQLDYFFAALGKRGIYITTDLFVSRPIPYKEIGIDKPGNVPMDAFKILVPVAPGAWENWKAFSKSLLEHVNKYTGKRNADDPALAWLSMINEGCFGNFTKYMSDVPEWKTAWNEWLMKRYKTRDDLAKAWGAALKADEDAAKNSIATPNNVYGGNARSRDENLFLAEKEREMVAKMEDFLHNEIKCKALITNSNAWTNHVTDQYKRVIYDYIDDHFYVDHPQFLQGDWRLPSRCNNTSPIAGGASGGRTCAFTRIFGKLFTITEYNYACPGRFRGVGGILTGAMGALQCWSGIWRFAYAHDHAKLFSPARIDYFDMVSDPLGQAAERASICLFLRGDMKAAPGMVTIEMNEVQLKSPPVKVPNLAANWHWAAWVTRIGTTVWRSGTDHENDLVYPPYVNLPLYWPGQDKRGAYEISASDIMALMKEGILTADNPTDPAKNIFRSETGEITIDAPNDQMILDTPKTAGGYAHAGTVIATKDGGVTIALSDSDATVWVSALDGAP